MRDANGPLSAEGLQTITTLMAANDSSASTFRQVLDALPTAIYTTDAQGRLTYFNPAAAKLSGRLPELGADTWCVTWKLYLPDGSPLPHDHCPMAIVLKGGEVTDGIECIGERPDGSRFWFAPYPSVLRDAEGRITGGVNLLVDITHRKTAELEANEQLRAIVETTPECVKIIASDGTLLFMNSPGLEMIGAPSAETVIGQNIYSLIAPENREHFRQSNEKVCRGEKSSIQFDMISFSGVRRHMETHAAPFRQADGSTVQLAIMHDITERKRTQRAALLLSAIIDSSDDAIISKDLGGIVTSWNKSAERIFGYTAEEAIGNPIAKLIIPADRPAEEPRILARLRNGERVDHFETVRQRKDGTLLDISVTISPVRDADDRIVGASKIARDITDRKRVETALAESEARFRQLADSMPQIVWTAQADGYIDYYNERWYQFTGLDRGLLGETSWQRLLHPEDLQRATQSWKDAVRTQAHYNNEYRMWDRRENRWRWFVGRAVPVRTASETVVKWFGTCTDIDEQKRIQDDLLRANQDLEQFAFSASHDLQEPLRTVKIYTQLLLKRHGEDLDGEARQFMQFIRTGATRMETLVRDLLAYTQISRTDDINEVAAASQVLDGALQNLSTFVAETGASIAAESLPTVRMHPTHLQQLFQNLVGNAIKYRSPDRTPQIHIGAERRDEYWVFSVVDNGIGIDPQYKEMIFGLFKRLHHGDDYTGTGIGLAICQRIVDRYDGRIWVESEPGRGSAFRFEVPV